jgi:hypothetical protein
VAPRNAVATVLLAALCAAAPAARAAALLPGDAAAAAPRPWTLRTRAVMSGSSTHSDPAGYKVYSGIGVEAAVARELTRALSGLRDVSR